MQHRSGFRRQQGHIIVHKIQLGVVEASVLADRQYRPTVPLFLQRPVPGAARHPATLLRSQRFPENGHLAGPSGLQQQQALRHVGQPHRPAAATVKEIQMQIAALHQRPDQPAGGPGAGGPHPTRIGVMKPRPPHNLTPLPGYPPLLLSVPREELCR
jgi:hypothetical protein